MPIRPERRWLVRHRVLAAQLFLNGGERGGYFGDLGGYVRSPARCFGNPFQVLVAASTGAGRVGADGIHRDLGSLRHLDGFLASHGACVVIAVAQQDNGTSDGASLRLLQQLVPARVVERIIYSRE